MKTFMLSAILIFLVFSIGCENKAPEGTVIAKVNNAAFTLEDLNEQIPPYITVPADRKQAFIEEWINTQLVYEASKAKAIDKDEKVQKKLKLLEKQFLANELLSRHLEGKGEVTDFEVKEYFEEHKRDFNSQIKIAHILLATEEEAKKTFDKLKSGEDFITLARTFSRDSITATNGGLLPRYFGFGEMIDTPEFEAAAFAIENVGGLSDIVKTNYGYHVVKLIDRKPTKEKVTFEDVGAQIKQYLTTKKQKNIMDTWLDSLKTSANIETHYDLLK